MCCYARPMLNRRTAIQAFAAGTAMLALPSMVASAQPPTRKPPRLRRGDTVGLIEPAGFTDDEFDLALVEETVRAMGLVPKAAPHLLQRSGYLAGRDEARAAAANALYADDGARAVFGVRGEIGRRSWRDSVGECGTNT